MTRALPAPVFSNAREEDANLPLVDLDFGGGDATPTGREHSVGATATHQGSVSTLDVDTSLVEINDRKYLKHYVVHTDTIGGLSIKYGVKVEDIKSVNKLVKEQDMWSKHFVLIPYHGQRVMEMNQEEKEKLRNDMRRRMIVRFRKATKCRCDSEAVYYLEDSLFDLAVAIRRFEEDLTWERETKLPSSSFSVKVQ